MYNVDGRSRPDAAADSRGELAASREIPLVVDLDGTLLATDTLFENALTLVRKSPRYLVAIPFWLLRGKTVLKAETAARTEPDLQHLPWRQELIAFLRTERAAGRRIVLATAASEITAFRAAAYLDLFDEVLSSTGRVNLKGKAKRDALVSLYGVRGFDYIGDSRDDIPAWAACRTAHRAGHRDRLPAAALASGARPGSAFVSPRPGFKVLLRSLRVHQWVKNILLFAPLLLSHQVTLRATGRLVLAFIAFSLVASGSYIVNDLFDLDVDRRHPRKRRRPFAASDLSITEGLAAALFLLLAGFGLSALTGGALAACLAVYLVLTLAYSAFLKNKPIIDVVVLALLYTLRIYAGGLVTDTRISPWLFQFSILSLLSLAFVKRYSELRGLRERRQLHAPGRGYQPRDLSIISQAGVGSGMLAGLVLALYVNSEDVRRLYPKPEMLWGICPLFLYWITRVWLIAHRGNMQEDPILYAFSDRVSYIVFFLVLILALMGAFGHAG